MADILTREADLIKNAEGGNVARLEANKIILEDGAGGGSSYSTDEKKVGKWVDGRTLYQKTIVLNVPMPLGKGLDVPHNISDLDIAVEANGYYKFSGVCCFMGQGYDESQTVRIWDVNNTTINLQIETGIKSEPNLVGAVTIKYVKGE